MVIRKYIACPTCEKKYQLKFQIDDSIKLNNWPVSFSCKDCGEILNFEFTKHGIKNGNVIECDDISEQKTVTTIGYSNYLPITEHLYMRDLNHAESIISFSPFLNITTGHFSLTEVSGFCDFVRKWEINLMPYQNVLKELLPIFLKGNLKAYSRKIANLFNIKDYRIIDNNQIMYDSYFELIKKSYYNILPQYYATNVTLKYFKPLLDYVQSLSTDKVREIKTKLDESGKISSWYKEKSLQHISDMIAVINKFIPSIIYLTSGLDTTQSRGDLKILTISHDEVINFYRSGYEILCKGLKVIVGIYNCIENDNVDIFKTSKSKEFNLKTLFANMSTGKMIEEIKEHKSINSYIGTMMNNKIRNAASHSGIKYFPENQKIECYYNPNDPTKVFDTTLMEVSYLSYVQLLHIMEITIVSREIVKRSTLK